MLAARLISSYQNNNVFRSAHGMAGFKATPASGERPAVDQQSTQILLAQLQLRQMATNSTRSSGQ